MAANSFIHLIKFGLKSSAKRNLFHSAKANEDGIFIRSYEDRVLFLQIKIIFLNVIVRCN